METLLTTAMFPFALPAEVGANATVIVVLCDGAKVSGREIALALNPVPVTVT